MKNPASTLVISLLIASSPIIAAANNDVNRAWYNTTSVTVINQSQEQYEGDLLEGKFLKAIMGAAEVGYLYAVDTNYLQEKILLLRDCSHQYIKYVHDFLRTDFDKQKTRAFSDCIANTKHPQLDKEESGTEEFKNFWSEYEVDNRKWYSVWGSATKYEVPHPFLVIRKIAIELGQFAILNAENGRFIDAFKLYVSDGVKLMLNRNSYGAVEYNEKMANILNGLKQLFVNNNRFKDDNKGNKYINNIPDGDLVALGRALHAMVVAAGKTKILAPEQKLGLGAVAGAVLHKMYFCMLALEEEQQKGIANVNSWGKDCHLPTLRERMSLGQEIINKHDKFIADNLKQASSDDVDTEVNAVYKLANQYQELISREKEGNARREQLKTKTNPLLEFIDPADEIVAKYLK